MNLFVSSNLLTGLLLMLAADQIPELRVETSCRSVTELNRSTGLADAQSYDGCMRDEQQARQSLAPIWSTFSAADRGRCVGEATAGAPSYVDLLVCLQMAKDAGALEQTGLKGARKSRP